MNPTRQALKIHDSNIRQLNQAIEKAGGRIDLTVGDVQAFLHVLAQNNVVLEARYVGEDTE